jgi:hypothetical protein
LVSLIAGGGVTIEGDRAASPTSPRSKERSDQVELTPTRDCGSAARHTELPVQVRNMGLCGVARDEQVATDVA